MSTSASESVAEQNLIDVPLYTLWDAAHFLRLSPWATLFLAEQGRVPMHPEWFFHHFPRRFPHSAVVGGIGVADDRLFDRERLSFRRLAEMFVREFSFQGLMKLAHEERDRGDRWARVYAAAWGVQDDQALFGEEIATEAVTKRLLAPFSQRMEEAELAWLEKCLLMRLDRVERVDGDPVRLYPCSRVPSAKSPRAIVLDPRVRPPNRRVRSSSTRASASGGPPSPGAECPRTSCLNGTRRATPLLN